MPVLRWVAHVLQAAIWYAANLAICAGIFLLSAHLATGPGPDDRNGAYFFRLIGSVWLFIATWNFVVRGILRRSRPVPDRSKKKPTGGEVVKGAAGCIVRLALIATTWALVGNLADWALAGLKGNDPTHPARRLLDSVLDFAVRVEASPDAYIPKILGAIAAVTALFVLLNFLSAPPVTSRQTRRAGQQQGPGRRKGQRRPDVAAANESAVTRAQQAAAARRGIDEAHSGAHRAEPLQPHLGHDFDLRGSMREDRVLGPLVYSSSDGAWWARRADGSFPLQLAGPADGPTEEIQVMARQVVQRAFEVLLRASDAARSEAQRRGVGLPRFTIATARIEPGNPPAVTLHLECEADGAHEYVVRSTDGLVTFQAG